MEHIYCTKESHAKLAQMRVASILERTQHLSAMNLRHAQEGKAFDLKKVQQDEADILLILEEHSAAALKQCQNEAACALESAHIKSAENLREKEQIILWLSGAYSHESE